ncbi:sulfatase-like hydrolase/transferase, partial [Verrucomicrobiales bacterium]|nr:sulfatase-like hydrolase/transferase [Verrucomicrobiales bacterium]
VGKLLEQLKKHGIEENTLILFTGDNGANIDHGGSSEPYRGGKGKHTQMEGWVHTPTIVTWPKVVPSGITYGGKMATFDFYATMAAAIDTPLPEGCDGKDLVPFLTGEKKGDVHEYLFWHNADPTDAPRRNLYAVRWKDWRFIKYPDGWKLFDLNKDPKERNDVASGNPKVVKRLTNQYESFVAIVLRGVFHIRVNRERGEIEKEGILRVSVDKLGHIIPIEVGEINGGPIFQFTIILIAGRVSRDLHKAALVRTLPFRTDIPLPDLPGHVACLLHELRHRRMTIRNRKAARHP